MEINYKNDDFPGSNDHETGNRKKIKEKTYMFLLSTVYNVLYHYSR